MTNNVIYLPTKKLNRNSINSEECKSIKFTALDNTELWIKDTVDISKLFKFLSKNEITLYYENV